MISNRHWRQIYAQVFLLVFVSFYSNVSFFQHSHIINGVTIVHSHIHSNHHSSSDDGGHTKAETTLISHLTNIELSDVNIFADEFKVILPSAKPFELISHIDDVEAIHLISPSLRAPPSYII